MKIDVKWKPRGGKFFFLRIILHRYQGYNFYLWRKFIVQYNFSAIELAFLVLKTCKKLQLQSRLVGFSSIKMKNCQMEKLPRRFIFNNLFTEWIYLAWFSHGNIFYTESEIWSFSKKPPDTIWYRNKFKNISGYCLIVTQECLHCILQGFIYVLINRISHNYKSDNFITNLDV